MKKSIKTRRTLKTSFFIKSLLLITFILGFSCEEEQFNEASSSNIDAELEKVPPVPGGTYFIRNRGSKLYMEVENASNSNGANVQQSSSAEGTHRQWEVISTGDGFVRLRGVDSRKSLTVEDK